MILFGHPTGNPNSHHAALAHFETGRLEAFCLPWMPGPTAMNWIGLVPGVGPKVEKYRRRCFPPLLNAPRIEGRFGEWGRLLRRMFFSRWADERLSYEANDWLMRIMAKECRRPTVTAVHAYEDCSLWQFEMAKRIGKKCIYDMPTGYYFAGEERRAYLEKKYADWLPEGGVPSRKYVRPEQKRKEMELADIVLAPSRFVERTISDYTDKRVFLAPYGVDADYWTPDESEKRVADGIVFIYAGQCSLQKGTHILLDAWESSNLKDATLILAGSWGLSKKKQQHLPAGVKYAGHMPADALRSLYRTSDVFVFPSYFDGFGLVLLEAMSCGLPAIATTSSAGPDIIDGKTGMIVPEGDVGALVEALRGVSMNRERIATMGKEARKTAATFTWQHYRRCVADAVGAIL